MALTRMTAKNTFGEGLIMDFAPDNVLANVLTNALNATLLTYNGNEMSLQNDMGNGRVETAFLPEGYVPMGTCEFGGIIYIVSYNPQDNLCQIGSFPSPERNITKDDRTDDLLHESAISKEQFLEIDKEGNLTGNLNTLVSKVIIREDSLNPGDKYIVMSNRSMYSAKDEECLSGLLDDNKAKRLKLSVVSVEDSGKITKLNTTNYKVESKTKNQHYIIANTNTVANLPDTDIDAYRKMLTQNYSVFDSKIPGKLAILAELEVISSFSCGHRVITNTKNGITTYDVYIDYKWESEDSTVNPAYINLTQFDWESLLKNDIFIIDLDESKSVLLYPEYQDAISVITEGWKNSNVETVKLPQLMVRDDVGTIVESKYFDIESKELSDSLKKEIKNYTYLVSTYDANHKRHMHFIDKANKQNKVELIANDSIYNVQINNELGISNTVHLFSVSVPEILRDYTFRLPFKLHYAITPAMDFGLLSHLTIDNEIDFSLLGTKQIKTDGIKYFTSSDLLTLNLDTNIYEEENHKITKMALEFYDPLGFCGSYFIEDREGYSGNQVINIPLNSIYLSKYKYDDINKTPIYHNLSNNMLLNPDTEVLPIVKTVTDPEGDTGDCGALYYNMLYGVKLIYEYSELDPLTGLPTSKEITTEGFWLYTNGQFNEYYYSMDDFRGIQPKIQLKYGYTLKDETKKNLEILDDTTLDFLTNLINKSDSDISNLNAGDNTTLTTLVGYKGFISGKILLGVDEKSLFGLVENDDIIADMSFKLQSPYKASNTFTVIEQNNTDNEELQEEPKVLEYNYEKAAISLSIPKGSFKKTTFTLEFNVELEIKDFPCKVSPTSFKKTALEMTVLTPILYSEYSDKDFNYYEVGGEKMFTRALCYVGSDDTKVDGVGDTSDERWYEVSIANTGKTTDTLIYQYPAGQLNKDLISGQELISSYYNALGNRQPFTLFTIQHPELSADGGYCTKWTINIFGPGHSYTTGDTKNFSKNQFSSGSYIIKLEGNWASEFTPNPDGRSYIPAFITPRIAEGGFGVTMCSGGGSPTSVKVPYMEKNKEVLPYTAQTYNSLARDFYPAYLNTLKLILTVNSKYRSCLVGTFTYNEDLCKNFELISLLGLKINNANKLKENAKVLTTLHQVPYSRYVKNVVKWINSSEKNLVISEENVNVDITFDFLEIATDDYVVITYLNYIIPHDHVLIDNYLSGADNIAVQFSNGYNELDASNLDTFVQKWNPGIYKFNSSIKENSFYLLNKEKDGMRLLEVNSLLHKPLSSGFITKVPLSSGGVVSGRHTTSSSSLAYSTEKNPLFYNTTMSVDDFIWDPHNSKHHFLFVSENLTSLVASEYSYELDDDSGKQGGNKIVRSYLIGPSFAWILK